MEDSESDYQRRKNMAAGAMLFVVLLKRSLQEKGEEQMGKFLAERERSCKFKFISHFTLFMWKFQSNSSLGAKSFSNGQHSV